MMTTRALIMELERARRLLLPGERPRPRCEYIQPRFDIDNNEIGYELWSVGNVIFFNQSEGLMFAFRSQQPIKGRRWHVTEVMDLPFFEGDHDGR